MEPEEGDVVDMPGEMGEKMAHHRPGSKIEKGSTVRWIDAGEIDPETHQRTPRVREGTYKAGADSDVPEGTHSRHVEITPHDVNHNMSEADRHASTGDHRDYAHTDELYILDKKPKEGEKSMHQQELVDEVGVEPFAASLLRRMHEDHCILMKDYHGALPHLEPDGATKKHVTKHLENMGSFLDNTESHFGKHFKDLPPLEGSMDQEEEETDPEKEEDTDEADSDEEELPPAEEAAEGMDMEMRGKAIRDREVSHATRKKIGRGVKQTLLRHGKALPQGEEYHKGIPEEERNVDEDLENVEEDMEQEDEDREEEDDLHDHELDKIDEASNYLDELGNKTDFEDKDRMESYHYHKSLEPMGSVEGYETKALEAGVGRFRKNIGNASSFFKMLSCEKAYGDPHREEAKVHATTLKNGLGELYERAEDQEEEETPDEKEREMIEEEDEEEGDVVAMPGEMGEKNQPSDNVSPSKARKILHDGEVNGHPITQKQRGMFGAAAGRGEKALDLTSVVIDRQNVIEDMMTNLNKLQEMVCN